MTMLKTNTPLDALLGGGLEPGILSSVQGPAASGKTNFAICAAIAAVSQGGQAIFLDTENGLSPARVVQVGGRGLAKKILAKRLTSFDEQLRLPGKLRKMKASIIIVDSAVALYRLELREGKEKETNRKMANWLHKMALLAETKKIPVLLTNQVYKKDGEIKAAAGDLMQYWPKTIVQFEITSLNSRVATLLKHRSLQSGKRVRFRIVEKGLKKSLI